MGTLLTFIFFPDFFAFKVFPYGQTTWEIADPAVSPHAFVPGFRVFKYELLNHGNVLWSSLRAMGQPLLGNEVQSAPLFPLTLLLLPIPEPYFWNFLVVLRFILLAAAGYLIATRLLSFPRASATLFVVVFAFALFILRSLNHPFHNTLVAGVWYLYFLARAVGLGGETPRYNFYYFGVGFTAYSLLTAGFPEGSVMAAVLVAVFLGPLFVRRLWQLKQSDQTIFPVLVLVLLAHGAGFFLASIPLFSILEYVQSAGKSFRVGKGFYQASSLNLFFHFITRVTDSFPKNDVLIHFFHLTPIFLFVTGTFFIKKWRWVDSCALALGIFYLVKAFPLWPAFNQLVGSLPLFNQTLAPSYFFPLFLFFFAYFVARGYEGWKEVLFEKKGRKKWVLLYAGLTLNILLVYIACQYEEPSRVFVPRMVGIFLCFILLLHFPWRKHQENFLGLGVLFFILLEAVAARPIHFMKYSDPSYAKYYSHTRGKALADLLRSKGLVPHEMRDRTMYGSYASGGISTVDDGFMAILPEGMKNYRNQFFTAVNPDWGAYVPFKGERLKDAWRASSVSLHEDPPLDGGMDPSLTSAMEFLGEVEGAKIYHDKKALARAYVATHCRKSTEPKAIELGAVTVDSFTEEAKAFCASYRVQYTPVSISNDKGSEVTLAPVAGPAVLVLNDFMYPGWKARDLKSGSALRVETTNEIFKAVFLPKGETFEVQFYYDPEWLSLAKLLTSVGAVILFFLLALPFYKRATS